MIDYTMYAENEDFMEILNYLRGDCIASECEVINLRRKPTCLRVG